ncbi:MAG: HlyD family efflux transporter periplasmic adaptor subunit [Lachnospiraceae bacterium]|nr:HlyD family efflux transporter periplasmic adaptor subunit [Lachnospiraceae bacterium]
MQDEKKEKTKKEIVKNLLIIFLIIMLLLTFFSNTIMNYSLPEVSTAYATEGSVTSKVRGSGVVETAEDYQVMVTDKANVSSVKVSVGDEVAEGDLLFVLDDKPQVTAGAASALEGGNASGTDAEGSEAESAAPAPEGGSTSSDDSELKAAEEALDALELEYNKALLELSPTYALDNLEIKTAQEDLNAAVEVQKKAQSRAGVAASLAEATKAVDQLTIEVSALQQEMESVSGNAVKKTEKKLLKKQKKLSEATALKESLAADLENIPDPDTAAADVRAKQKALDTLLITLSEKKREDGSNAGKNNLDLADKRKKIEAARELVNKLKYGTGKVMEVRSKNAGVVKTINCIAGDSVTPDSPLATIAVTGNGYTLTLSVTKEQAKLVRQGQEATITNIWGDDISATLNRIKPDLEDPNNKKVLEFSVKGSDVTVGQNLDLSVGEKSSRYDVVVPNSAIREDNNGKYVLVVNVKNSPLGNRYVLSRADVEVQASDDTNSAVTGSVYAYDYVVTNSTKPLESGMKVRLSDTQ